MQAISMRTRLKHLFSDNATGLKIAAAGFFVAIVGAALQFAGLELGGWVVNLGILLGMVGVAMHFVVNWRKIFRIDQ